MKFIHAADIHLDSPLHGLRDYPDAPAEQLRNASREALRQLVDRTIEETAAFLVIAGDLYDGDWKDHNTGIFFSQQMGRLRKAGIRAFVLYGNHDAESEMTKKLTLPDNVTLFNHRKPQTHVIEDLGVALHGQSFKDRAVTENLALGYPSPTAGLYNIGVLHTALEGYAAHSSYAPCSRAELDAKGYDYWALGHVHEFQHWTGPSTIVFPGNLQGRHVRETGRRGAVIVTVEDGHTRIERLYLDILRWESLRVDASDCTSIEDLSRRIGTTLEDLLSIDGHVPRAIRITVGGRTRAHGHFFGRAQQLRAEVLNQIGVIGNDRLWLEKLRLETLPEGSADARSENLEALEDLKRILESARQDPDFLALLERDLQPFVGRIRSEVRDDELPLLALARAGSLDNLLEQVGPALLSRLASGE